MSDLDRVVAELALRNLLARYCHCYDQGRVDEYCELFTEDGEFRTPDILAQGRDEIRAKIAVGAATAPPAQHVTYNTAIEVDGEGHASGRSDFMYVGAGSENSIRILGRYIDEFVREEGIWRFRRRTVEFASPQP